MELPSSALRELADSASRLGGQAAGLLKDRLELLALELREDKIRVIQVLLLACVGSALMLFGLLLLAAAAIYALPPELRLAGMVLAALAALITGGLALAGVKRRLGARHGVFAQSIAELKKDTECF